ncbi:hypothetical protein MNBD_GAMMA22-1208, partial [hydrothermal vent metagenome]
EYNEDPSLGQIIVNTLLTLIPVVDQVGDIRDTTKYLKDLIWDKRYAEFAVWAGLILTIIGWIPEFGSLIKGIVKLIRKGGKSVNLDDVFKVFNFFAKGNAVKWIKELLAKLPKHQKFVTTQLNDLFSGMIDTLQSVKAKLPSAMSDLIKKFDDTIATINKARDEIDTMVGRYFTELKQDLDDLIARFGKSKPDTVGTKKTFSKKQSSQAPKKSSPETIVKKIDVDELAKFEVRAGGKVLKAEGKILEGTNGKVAIIGRSMGNPKNGDVGVLDYAEGLKKQGHDVETFSGSIISGSVNDDFKKQVLKAKNKRGANARLTDSELQKTKMYTENETWAKKLKNEGYTVVNIGDPNNYHGKKPPEFSVFYEMEKNILF